MGNNPPPARMARAAVSRLPSISIVVLWCAAWAVVHAEGWSAHHHHHHATAGGGDDVVAGLSTQVSPAPPPPGNAGPAVICQDVASGALRALRTGPCPGESRAVRVAAANIFDQLWVGSTSMNTGENATYPDALAALESAAASGVRVFRFFGSLFGAATAAYVTNASTYWREYDRLMDDIERLGMYAIPSLGTGQWHEVANAVIPGLNESLNDGVRNKSSVAYTLQARYFAEVVER